MHALKARSVIGWCQLWFLAGVKLSTSWMRGWLEASRMQWCGTNHWILLQYAQCRTSGSMQRSPF